MEEYPKTMQEFEEKFSSEQSCIDYLFRIRWPEGFRCPRCGHDKFWAMSFRVDRRTSQSRENSFTALFNNPFC
ncbi:MAG: transposase [Deltaproteobacteria bacterium]|nr:transposase [Deltaproteobacteria bacterium]